MNDLNKEEYKEGKLITLIRKDDYNTRIIEIWKRLCLIEDRLTKLEEHD